MSDPETIKVYDARAEEYAQMSSEENFADPRLETFITSMPTEARVLDIGCGPGQAAARMAQAGLRVEATDASAEMAERANKLDGVTAWQATFDEITGTAIYDGIWANFCLLHAPRTDMPRHLAALRTALKPDGIFHIGMKLGTGEARDSIGRLYTYYSQDELTNLLTEANLVVTDAATGRTKGLDGTMADWVTLAAHA
ncbi:MAG: class I SAM-dependent methyltransferase [Paracoccaceae bacterium]